MMRFRWLIFFLLLGNLATAQLSEQQFLRPDAVYSPTIRWVWKSNNVDREGINLDLEALTATGLWGGCIDLYANNPSRLDSARWSELLLHALQQADRLGLTFDLTLPASFSRTSIQTQPELAAQHLVWSETTIRGAQQIDRILPKPLSNTLYYKDEVVLAFPEGNTVDIGNIKNLSDLLNVEGRLIWNAPKGDWTIVRFGSTTEDVLLGDRLPVDEFSQMATRRYFDVVLKPIIDQAAPFLGRSLTGLSLQADTTIRSTWSPLFGAYFQQQMGYDWRPYLLAFTGRLVGNVQQTNRFRWDLKRLQSRIREENHIAVLRSLLKPYGLKLNAKNANKADVLNAPLLMKSWMDGPSEGPICLDFELMPYDSVVNPMVSSKLLNRNHPLLGVYADCFSRLKRCGYVLQHASPVFRGACFIGEDSDPMPSDLLLENVSYEHLLDSVAMKNRLLTLSNGRSYRYLALLNTRNLSLPLLRKLKDWLSDGLWVSAARPIAWTGILKPSEQIEWSNLVNEIWSQLPKGVYRFGSGRLFIDTGIERVMKEIGWKPNCTLTSSDTSSNVTARHLLFGKEEVWFLSNRQNRSDTILAMFRTNGMQPEWWNPTTGEVRNIRIFRQLEEQTLIPLLLEPNESGFVVFRKNLNETAYDGISKDGELLYSADSNFFPDNMPANNALIKTEASSGLPRLLFLKEGMLVRSKGTYTMVQPGILPKKQHKMQIKSDLPVYELTQADTAWKKASPIDTTTWRCSFNLTLTDLMGNRLMLDAGSHTDLLADVYVNGKSAGSFWTSPFRIEVTNLVNIGENSLEIKFLSTGTGNKQTNLFRNPFVLSAWKVMKY